MGIEMAFRPRVSALTHDRPHWRAGVGCPAIHDVHEPLARDVIKAPLDLGAVWLLVRRGQYGLRISMSKAKAN